ncbi:MAG: phosphoglycerate kinase [Alphaproteobacteria bacterium]|nr:phosphoglycerate kinase [Alphaproteobacteria bacterium]
MIIDKKASEFIMQTIHDILPFMKNVLVRVDWNVPIQDGIVLDNSRILETLPTIMGLLSAGKHITILTHLGRPKEGYQAESSLKLLQPEIEKLLQHPVNFIEDLDQLGHQWEHPISLFENIRFFPGEETNEPQLAKSLIKKADVFVNDAFSVSHRAHTSVEGVTHHLPHCAGLLMERELSKLIYFHEHYERPLMAICGGAKISSKIDFIQNMLKKAKTIALVGGLANTFLKAKGLNVGLSLVEDDAINLAKKIIDQAVVEGCELWIPNHVRVGKTLADTPFDKPVTEISSDERILDIAPQSLDELLEAANDAKTIIWNGALGVFENSTWSHGTFTLAKELGRLTQQKQFQTLAGGGETVMALRQTNTFNQFTYVSLAGGAFMEFMEGRKLPGVLPLLSNSTD